MKKVFLAPLLVFAIFGSAFGKIENVCSVGMKANLEPYIIGGEPVEPREFPGFVSIRINDTHICAGAIISSKWILTIAHCMVYITYSYRIVAGSDKLTSGGTEHNVTDIIIHYGYDMEDSWKNDIAVVEVDPPIELNGNNKAVTLPPDGQHTDAGETGWIIGFGSETLGGPLSEDLRKAEVVVIDHRDCSSIYLTNCNRTVHETQLCAGAENKGFCAGDTGGPLFIKDEVVGIASWTNKCAEEGFPDVYTDVSSYIPWIRNNTSF